MLGIGNTVKMRLVCADPISAVSKLSDNSIIVNHVEIVDDLTVLLVIKRTYLKNTLEILDSMGISFTVLQHSGIVWHIIRFLKRPVLVAAIVLFLLITLLLPNRVLFVCVEGNASVPAFEILSAVEEKGLYFGANGSIVRSERVKNYLLENIPELKWVGVNIRGCVATVSVKERAGFELKKNTTGILDMTASRDGVIRQMTVYSGTALCTVGQAVRQGQLLISGYEDCGRFIRAVNADGEIFADTTRLITIRSPLEWRAKGVDTHDSKKYSVIFAKNRINLFKDTGISGASCVKMYKQYYINLPGNFILPISIVEYTESYYKPEIVQLDATNNTEWIDSFAKTYLQNQMISGSILRKRTEMTWQKNYCTYYGEYTCREMIGQLRSEEINEKNE